MKISQHPVSLYLTTCCLLLCACGPQKSDEFTKPVPGNFIYVETRSMDMPTEIMLNVQLMLQENVPVRQKMMSHGSNTPTSYRFKFNGKCAEEQALIDAVRKVVRKSTSALVVCTATPPAPEFPMPVEPVRK
jgi:hypothetical protein